MKTITKNPIPFDSLKRTFETAYIDGSDYTDALYAVGSVVVYSVLGKLKDPQRKAQADKVSDSGCNPEILNLIAGVQRDKTHLLRVNNLMCDAINHTYNDNGECVESVDKEALKALNAELKNRLSDSYDLVQESVTVILELAEKRGEVRLGWLDTPYMVSRLSKRVYIQLDNSAEYKIVDTCPLRETFRAIRDYIAKNASVKTNPASKYCYIDDIIAGVDDMDTAYYRCGKYADIGGYDASGVYAVSKQDITDISTIINALNLTPKQENIIKLRLAGYGYKAIATYCGVTHNAIINAMKKVQKKYNSTFGQTE